MNPAHWGNEFPTCGLGKSQSPVDIKGPFVKATQALAPDYRDGALKIVNNGHTIQVNVEPGSKLTVGGQSFDLLQFHFHRPSEEKVNGKPLAMVAHFVHKNQEGKLVVLGVLLKEGAENPALKSIWANAPKSEGPKAPHSIRRRLEIARQAWQRSPKGWKNPAVSGTGQILRGRMGAAGV